MDPSPRAPTLRLITLVLCVCHFMVSIITYEMSLSANNYRADPFTNMALAGLMEVPGYTLMALIVARLGRKWPTIVCYAVSGTIMLALAYISPGIELTTIYICNISVSYVKQLFRDSQVG